MPLTLKVISYRGLPQSQAISAVFDQDGGSLGRSTECNFVLPDPEKYISRKHARIEYADGAYRLIDISSAGTGVANRNLLLQHDSIALGNGDRLKIGDYEIQVTITEDVPREAPIFPGIPEPSLAPQTSTSPDDLFGFGPAPFGDLSATPAAHADEARKETPSFIENPDVALFRSSFSPPEPEAAPAAADLSDFNIEDLLAELEHPTAGAAVRAPSPKPPEPDWEIPDDLLKGFDIAFHSAGEGQQPFPPEAPASSERPLQETELAAGAVIAPPREAFAEAAVRIPKPAPSGVQKERPAEVPVAPAVEPPVPVPAPVAGERRDSELFRLFLQGAGIADASFVQEEELPKLMTTLGMLFRDLSEGLMTVLRARTELKSQFRVTMTTMRPVNNNPLKFTANVEDAMKVMLARDHPGFVDPVKAVREGFSDLMNHQMAMAAGVQASLAELLKRFDPNSFEKSYEAGIVFHKKAKCWDAYSKAYGRLVEEATENFFGEGFAEAYEEQLQALRAGNGRRGGTNRAG